MFLLGMRLALQGGREAIVRLIATALAVMIGSVLLLSVLAVFQGYQAAGNKPCFKVSDSDCSPIIADPESSEAVLALYRKDTYKGQTITRLDLAKLSDYSIAIPGVLSMPQAGEYYVSPAMEHLLNQASAEELTDRYPGKQAGTISKEGLHSPDELVIIIGRDPADLADSPGVVKAKTIGAQEATDSNATFLQFASILGAAALLFPMLVLIGSAMRLGASRREERYAAFRLVGATPKQINIIASADAVLGSVFGVMAGIAGFFALQPILADLAITGSRFFTSDVRPTVWQLALVAVGVPVSAVIAAFLALRRVKISPLGVSRKATASPPGLKGLWPLALGAVIFTGSIMVASSDDPPFVAVPGLILIMIGLVTSGPWLTMQVTHILARLVGGPSTLLAMRRLADNPQAAFRSVSGLVLVVFTASLIAGFVPIALTQRLATEDSNLNNTLTVEFSPADSLQPAESRQLIAQLQAISGVKTFPIYSDPSAAPIGPGARQNIGPPPVIIGCDSLEQLQGLGTCPEGTQATTISSETYQDVILLHQIDSVVTSDSQPRSIDPTTMRLRGLLVQTASATALEKARTMLSKQVVAPIGESLLTFGETKAAAETSTKKLQAIITAGVIITLTTAGASIAVATAGGIVERRRPFTLLRLSGAPLSTLYKVVLWEAAVPLISAALVAALIGLSAAALAIITLAPPSSNVSFELPSLPYVLTLIAGPVVALLIVCITLPLVGKLTRPDNARFE